MTLFWLVAARCSADDLSEQLPKIKRVYVDQLTGGETAAQMRDLIITALQNSKLFIVTENQERADCVHPRRGRGFDLHRSVQIVRERNMRGNSSDSEGVELGFAL